jgi:hypothetical protein
MLKKGSIVGNAVSAVTLNPNLFPSTTKSSSQIARLIHNMTRKNETHKTKICGSQSCPSTIASQIQSPLKIQVLLRFKYSKLIKLEKLEFTILFLKLFLLVVCYLALTLASMLIIIFLLDNIRPTVKELS